MKRTLKKIHVSLGIDQLPAYLKTHFKKRVRTAGLCHPASVDSRGIHLATILEQKSELTRLFGPQHGIYGETQDNMIEWQDTKDPKGLPIYSLYGERRKPTREQLMDCDLVVVDLFDVGARYYTFIYTLSYMMEVCSDLDIPVLVCDRPNPLSGLRIEGPILDPQYRSFVGLHPIPVCHGMTIGELARYFHHHLQLKNELHIVKLKGWRRSLHFSQTSLQWTLPSPNMPNFEACLLYPGMCLLEGTTLSEGRGTTRPFELIGAPFFDWNEIEQEYRHLCKALKLTPIHFHRQGFLPTFHKFTGEVCRGSLQFVADPNKFLPLRHMAVLLWIFRKLYRDSWGWKLPPYEYEFEKLPIDILAGGPQLRECIDQQGSLKNLFRSWSTDEQRFKKSRRPFLLYR